MALDPRDANFSAESPDLEEDGGGGREETESEEDLGENEDVIMPEPNEVEDDDPEYENLNSPSAISTAAPLISTTENSKSSSVTVALPSGSALPIAAIPSESDYRMTEIVHQRPPIDDSRRLFQRLWTDEDEIELLRGFLDYITTHRGNNSSHPPDMAPFYEQIKSKLQLEFNKNQLVEKLRRLKKKYRNVISKISSGKEVFFKSPHDQATFDISRKIWNQTGKIIGFEDNNAMDLEETNNNQRVNNTNGNVDVDSENCLEKKMTMSGSRKRSRSRIWKIEEDKPVIAPCEGPILNENVAAIGEFSEEKNNLGQLIEETVKNCVSPLIKEMMNSTTGMMMATMGGFPGGNAHGLGGLSAMLMPSMNLGFGGKGVGDERWRRQQILELEVYSRRLELVQEQIRATVNELKTTPSGGV